MTWDPDTATLPDMTVPTGTKLRFWLRALPFATFIAICFVLLLILRPLERWIYGMHRPVTPYLTQAVCRSFFVFSGITFSHHGKPMPEHGAIVANHASWMDIFTLHAAKRIYFVSKAEVRGWPGIGALARATGTIFINRDRRESKAQEITLRERLSIGHKLLFFPEGTSTDALRVLPFKSTLFAAFYHPDLRHKLSVQPVTVIYRAPDEQPANYYGWWGDMSFGNSLIRTIGAARQGSVEVIYHPPLKVAEYPDRKALSKACEEIIRAAMPPERQLPEG